MLIGRCGATFCRDECFSARPSSTRPSIIRSTIYSLQLSVSWTLDGTTRYLPSVYRPHYQTTDIMSFVTRRALSTLIPPKVSPPKRRAPGACLAVFNADTIPPRSPRPRYAAPKVLILVHCRCAWCVGSGRWVVGLGAGGQTANNTARNETPRYRITMLTSCDCRPLAALPTPCACSVSSASTKSFLEVPLPRPSPRACSVGTKPSTLARRPPPSVCCIRNKPEMLKSTDDEICSYHSRPGLPDWHWLRSELLLPLAYVSPMPVPWCFVFMADPPSHRPPQEQRPLGCDNPS